MKCYIFLAFYLLSIKADAQKLYWYIENSRIGYKNEKGETVIKPQYVMANAFSEGLACVGVGDNMFLAKYGFINESGAWVIQPQFDGPGDFSDGIANVSKDHNWGFIDKKGAWVVQPQYSQCYEFRNSYAQVSKKSKWGLIDKKGVEVLAPEYYDVTNVSDGVLAVNKEIGKGWELIDIKGRKLSDKTFDRVKEFNGGLAPARNNEDKYGFINAKGEWVILPEYTGAESFGNDLAAVEIDYKWGYIDRTGKIMIQPEYDRPGRFKNGVAMVEQGSEYLYINTKGNVILRFNK